MRPSFQTSVKGIKTAPESRTWYRALQTHFLSTALSTSHTKTVASRFNGASPGSPGFEILYLAENHLVALLEVQALLGSPMTPPGGLVPSPHSTWTVLNVSVTLQAVADLTDISVQNALEITAQELTGDWLGYRWRGPGTTVRHRPGWPPLRISEPPCTGFPAWRVSALWPRGLHIMRSSWSSPRSYRSGAASPGTTR